MWIPGLALLLLAMVPGQAMAQDGGTASGELGLYVALGVIALQVISSWVTNNLQRQQAMVDKGSDAQLSTLKAQIDGMAGQLAAQAAQLQATREEYARRVDTEKAIRELRSEMQEDMKENRAELRELRGEFKVLQADVTQMSADLRGLHAETKAVREDVTNLVRLMTSKGAAQ